MLNPLRIYNLLHAQPFEPLRFKFSDGTEEVVRHPETAIVTQTAINIAQFSGDDQIPDWMKTYALAHLVSVEPVQPQQT